MLNMIEEAKRLWANFKLNKNLGDMINFYGFFNFHMCPCDLFKTCFLKQFFFDFVNNEKWISNVYSSECL